MTFVKRWFKSLLSEDRRNESRHDTPHLQAYYLEGGPPSEHPIRDISLSGLYLHTNEEWYPGTLVTLTLQRTGCREGDPDRVITVHGQVVRSEKDGVGLRFALPNSDNYNESDLTQQNRSLRSASKKKFTEWMQQYVIKKSRDTCGD